MTVVIDGTTGISGVDGTASNPSYEGADSNTGIFFPAADTIAFAEGGAEVARFNSSGDFGIGTSSPASRLHVTGLARICDPAAYILFRNAADSTSNGVVQFPDTGEASIVNYRNTNLTLGANNSTHVRITAAGLFQFNSGYGSVATAYGCRAWATFTPSTGAILASGNMTSITRNSTGNYTANFTNAMPDENYAMALGIANDSAGNSRNYYGVTSKTASAYRFSVNAAGAAFDPSNMSVVIFR